MRTLVYTCSNLQSRKLRTTDFYLENLLKTVINLRFVHNQLNNVSRANKKI